MKKILILVDPQVDFITGSLAVPGAFEAMQNFCKESNKGILDQYDKILVTLDFHPKDHCSFKQFGGIFPPHCVEHTEGAAVFSPVTKVLHSHDNVEYFIKGTNKKTEEFSILKSPSGHLDFMTAANWFKGYEIHVAGIAGDFCVHDTIKDLCTNYEVFDKIKVLKDFIASIDGGQKLDKLIIDLGLKI